MRNEVDIGKKAVVVFDDVDAGRVRTLKGIICDNSEFLISIIDDSNNKISVAKKTILKIVVKNGGGVRK